MHQHLAIAELRAERRIEKSSKWWQSFYRFEILGSSTFEQLARLSSVLVAVVVQRHRDSCTRWHFSLIEVSLQSVCKHWGDRRLGESSGWEQKQSTPKWDNGQGLIQAINWQWNIQNRRGNTESENNDSSQDGGIDRWKKKLKIIKKKAIFSFSEPNASITKQK